MGRIEQNQEIERRLKDLLGGVVERGLSVDAKGIFGETALHLVAEYWGEDHLPDSPEVKTLNDALRLPLNSVSALAIAKILLTNGSEVDPRKDTGQTPLHIAAQYDNLKIASILLEHGANVISINNRHATPLHMVAFCGQGSAQMAELLLVNGALVDAKDMDLVTPLHAAAQHDHLMEASVLLKRGADVNSRNIWLQTPLHYLRSRRMAKLLLTNGAIVDARDKKGRTPLHNASDLRILGAVQDLVKFGADVSATDYSGDTALNLVEKSGYYNEDTRAITRLLTRSAADEGNTATQGPFTPEKDKYTLAVRESFRAEQVIATSIELEAAGLSCTRSNFEALYGREYDAKRSAQYDRYHRFHRAGREFKLACEAEVKKLKDHMLTDSMSLHAFMLTDNVHCISSRNLLDALRFIDYHSYPTYEYFLESKFEKLGLMVFAIKVLLESGANNIWSLPEELLPKILVHLDSVDLCNLMICGARL